MKHALSKEERMKYLTEVQHKAFEKVAKCIDEGKAPNERALKMLLACVDQVIISARRKHGDNDLIKELCKRVFDADNFHSLMEELGIDICNQGHWYD